MTPIVFWTACFTAGYCLGGKEGIGYVALACAGLTLFVAVFND
jgi:hypothetical protein